MDEDIVYNIFNILWFLTEGESAGGSASNGSDKDTQAFLLFKGIVANPLKCTLSEIMENDEWKAFINVLRCGIGPTFDINKLYYDRINILTDSDSDGLDRHGSSKTFLIAGISHGDNQQPRLRMK